MMFDASIIVPTYNREDELKLTLDSFVAQRGKHHFEVIVCDDGSTDGTEELVGSYSSVLNIKYLYQEDKGFRAATARNMGIKAATGELCIFVDSGIMLHPNAVTEYLKIYSREGECTIIGYLYGFDTVKLSEEKILELKEIISQNSFEESIPKLTKKNYFDVREKSYQALGDDLNKWAAPFIVFWSGNVAVPKKVLDKVGMFDEFFNTWGGEDTELGLTLQKANVKYVLSREACGIHYPHEIDKTNLWNENPEEAYLQLVEKQKYMLNKHPINAMKLYTRVYDPILLNQILAAHEKKQLQKKKATV